MRTLTLWTQPDPFAQLDALVRSTSGRALVGTAARPSTPAGFTPAAETTRDGDDAVLRVELPGLGADDIAVELQDGRLVVRGERRDERTDEQGARRLREVRYGAFRRSFAVPASVTSDAVTASYDAGVLTVRVAGVHAGTEPQRIAVTSGTAVAAVQTGGEQQQAQHEDGEQAAA